MKTTANPDVLENCQRPQASAPVSLLGAINQATKGFDMEAWKKQDSSCLLCHTSMGLDFGCEWPDDPRLLLCWSCMSNVCAELLAMVEAPNDGTQRRRDENAPLETDAQSRRSLE